MTVQHSSARFRWLVIGPFLIAVALLAALGVGSAEILSAVRAYVGGESLWSKGQKDAVYHLAGFADEADASAVAWLACTLGDPDLAYSGHLSVVLEAASAMPPSVWRELRPKLDPGVVEDIVALEKRLKEQEPVVRDTAFKVYDRYLKSNGVSDGVRSYSRMLRVVVAMGTPRRP